MNSAVRQDGLTVLISKGFGLDLISVDSMSVLEHLCLLSCIPKCLFLNTFLPLYALFALAHVRYPFKCLILIRSAESASSVLTLSLPFLICCCQYLWEVSVLACLPHGICFMEGNSILLSTNNRIIMGMRLCRLVWLLHILKMRITFTDFSFFLF